MDDRALLEAWNLDGERRALEPSSLDTRDRKLRCFARSYPGLLTAGREDVEAFLDVRRNRDGRPLAARSRYHWISTLHTFYAWAMREGLTDTDPTVHIVRPKLRRLMPRPWSGEDMERAIAAASPTMGCWIVLAAYAGFRCMEIAALTRDDVLESWHPKLLIARGKGSKERTVPLHPRVESTLLELPLPRRGFVFTRPNTSRPYHPATVSSMVSDHFSALGMAWTAHQGRHWFGSQMLEACGDLRVVQETMGHESMATTAGYTMWSKARAAQAVAAIPSAPRQASLPFTP